MDARNEIVANDARLGSAGANDGPSKDQATCRLSTGSKKQARGRKLSGLFSFPSVLKKLNGHSLFPHKIKAISDDPNVHNRKSSADAHRRADNLSGGSAMDGSTPCSPMNDPVGHAMSERSAKRNSIRKSISDSIRNSMRSAP